MMSIFTKLKRQRVDEVVCPPGEVRNINHLSDEVLLRVFAYVELVQLLLIVPKVCQRWCSLHTDPSLYRHLSFTRNEPTTADAITALKLAPWLRSLVIRDREDTDRLLAHVTAKHRHCTKLVLHSCHGTATSHNVSSLRMHRVLYTCQNLQHLSLKGTSLQKRLLYTMIGRVLPSLRVVDFGNMPDSFGEVALRSLVQHCDAIEVLRINNFLGAGISSEMVVAVCTEFRDTLRMADFDESVSWNDAILKAIAECRNVTSLNLLRANLVTDQGLDAIGRLNKVTKLRICTAGRVTAQGFIRLFSSPGMRHLKYLYLHTCVGVDDSVAAVIANNLRQLKQLKIINCRTTTPVGRVAIPRNRMFTLCLQIKQIVIEIFTKNLNYFRN